MSWDAAVRYERGWAAFFWSGLLQVEVRLREVLAELAEDLREYSVGPDAGLAGGAGVRGGRWRQRVLIFRVARSLGVERMAQGVVRG